MNNLISKIAPIVISRRQKDKIYVIILTQMRCIQLIITDRSFVLSGSRSNSYDLRHHTIRTFR